MKKLVLFVCLMCGMMAALQAQNVVFSDNFDSYTAGQKLCSQNNTDWTTWSNSPGSAEDAVISTEQASSGSNSLKITGSNDIIYRFSNQTTGVFDVEFDYYIPSTGSGAYFNIQHYYNPGVQWAFECYFTNNGTGYIDVANNTYNFTMPNDAWFHVKAHIDLDMDSITVTVNNVDVHTWPFSAPSIFTRVRPTTQRAPIMSITSLLQRFPKPTRDSSWFLRLPISTFNFPAQRQVIII